MSMLIKAHEGNGHWRMWNAESDLSFLGPHVVINQQVGEDDSVTIATEDEIDEFVDGDDSFEWAHDFWDDERFPTNGVDTVEYLTPGEPITQGGTDEPTRYYRNLRWVKFHDGKVMRMVITDGPIFILNEMGDTVESIRN